MRQLPWAFLGGSLYNVNTHQFHIRRIAHCCRYTDGNGIHEIFPVAVNFLEGIFMNKKTKIIIRITAFVLFMVVAAFGYNILSQKQGSGVPRQPRAGDRKNKST